MRAPFAPPRLSLPRNVAADAQAVVTSWAIDRPGCEDRGLERRDVVLADQLMIDGGNRVLPHQRLFGDERAEIPHDRAHVAVRQLEPRPGECVRELIRILEKAP